VFGTLGSCDKFTGGKIPGVRDTRELQIAGVLDTYRGAANRRNQGHRQVVFQLFPSFSKLQAIDVDFKATTYQIVVKIVSRTPGSHFKSLITL